MRKNFVRPGKELNQSVYHYIADEKHLFLGNAFARKVFIAIGGWSEEQVRELVGNEAVDLFGHSAIKGAQACLDMSHANVKFGTYQCRRYSRIYVAIDQHNVRLML